MSEPTAPTPFLIPPALFPKIAQLAYDAQHSYWNMQKGNNRDKLQNSMKELYELFKSLQLKEESDETSIG